MEDRRRACGLYRRWLGRAAAVGLAAGYALAAPAGAQQGPVCPEGRITEVVIENQSVFDLSDPGRASARFSWAYRLANSLHRRTRADVIERELLFSVGDCYEVAALRDSERLLRGFGFLANAEIYGVRQGEDAVQVVVDTQDEWSTKIDPSVGADEGIEFRGIELAEDNLLGTGQHVSLFYEKVEEQWVYGAAYSTPQLVGSRTNLSLRVDESEVGTSFHEAITYPFVGETGRVAGRQEVERRDRYFEILMPGYTEKLEPVWVPVRREHVEFGAAFRRGGERYRHTLLGVAIAGERIAYPGMAVFGDTVGRPAVPSDVFSIPWKPTASVRLVGLIGRRDVEFVQRRGFDTVDGTEDVQLGFDGEVSLGISVPGISRDENVSLGGRVGWADEPVPELTYGGQVTLEMRHDVRGFDSAAGFEDVLAELDGWVYFRSKAGARQTLVGSFSAVSGWNSTLPFQLTLGGITGMRGYPRHLDPGGRRMVASVEHRAYLGWPLPDLIDLGSVVFADVGKIWPGDVPFGVESPIRGTVGIGIRAGFPPGSRQTFRADIGLPIQREIGFRGIVVSVGVGQSIGRRVARPDRQLLRSARYGLTTSDFLFPH